MMDVPRIGFCNVEKEWKEAQRKKKEQVWVTCDADLTILLGKKETVPVKMECPGFKVVTVVEDKDWYCPCHANRAKPDVRKLQ